MRRWTEPLNAENDLPWLWGTGPATAEGDCGLRSPFGGMLARAKEGVVGIHLRDDDGDDDRRLITADRMRRVRARLETLEPEMQTHLWAHYSQRRLPFGISAAAMFTRAAVAITGDDVPSVDALRGHMRDMKAQDNKIKGLEKQADDLVRSAVEAYNGACRPAKTQGRLRSWTREARDQATAMQSEYSRSAAEGGALDAEPVFHDLDAKLSALDTMLAKLRAA